MSTVRSEEHTSELQSLTNLVCRLLLEKKKKKVRNQLRSAVAAHTAGAFAWRRQTGWCTPAVARYVVGFYSGWRSAVRSFFFFNDTATTEIYTLSLHDALPI